jgi:DNA-binding response OmpR family regulator
MKLFLDGAPLDLTTTEFKLLTTLMENDTAVHTRADLLR